MLSQEAQQADVVIVGAGMVGSALALALSESDLQITLVDAAPLAAPPAFNPQSRFSPRVSALSAASQRLLEDLGAWPRILSRRSCPYSAMQVWDGSGSGQIEFSAANLHTDVLGHIVENSVVQDALLECLQNTSVRLRGNAPLAALKQSENGWQLELASGERLEAPLLLAADGGKSKVRELAGFAVREWDYLHQAIVTSVYCEKPHQYCARQCFTDDGPLAFLPLGKGKDEHWCSIVWSVVPDQAARLMALEDEAFCQALSRAFEYRLGRVEKIDPRLCIPLRQRHAKRYIKPALALLGDAAHCIHPLAGQGVNLGFLDVAALSSTLRAASKAGETLGNLRVLARYERQRMPHNLAMMAAMEGFERLFQADALPLRWLRGQMLNRADHLPLIKNWFAQQALGR
ncbi:2-octaprenyl-3-methyl-6-methoxy-1,4-benzoquinol hydroxylase [Ventosimonas gracilis]|uniref:2-octaprenyl-3-methyl-6-methoxy-1,4-benzoquinol hydroxylase n=1 Tax=Ventosimonas gracilis TaxID=1680762 RepID=A0A139SHI0_9GAMM|nr:FAD-dependent monooxygenase [Ventosimonas gracilis]KXU33940.1 2-octaprenyl-3-methyl-6-methoxy-1,4-benzoquinol hydroxylase [Ventosimonas gracilis]